MIQQRRAWLKEDGLPRFRAMRSSLAIRSPLAISVWVILLAFAFAKDVCAQKFALKDGDTVVFYGDSITAQHLYTRDVEDFVLTRYPTMHVRFVNAGVPGDNVRGGYVGTMPERVQRDVAPYRPTMITVMLGMNDGGWGFGDSTIDANFQNGYRALLDELGKAAPDAAFTLVSSTPYDEVTHGTEFPGYSHVIDRFAGEVDGVARQLQASKEKVILTADFHRPMVQALEQAKAKFPALAPLLIPDRIHPSAPGHWIMAAALMSAWHLDPVVSKVMLDGKSGLVISKAKTTITELARSGDGYTWTQTDDALPLPLDFNDAMTPVLLAVSNLPQLDQLMLTVESLRPGKYQLSIDGKPVGAFSNAELENGVNLALYKTPMVEQAREIDGDEEERAALDRASFILTADVKQAAATALAQATLRQAEENIEVKVRSNLTPRPHKFALSRIEESSTRVGAPSGR